MRRHAILTTKSANGALAVIEPKTFDCEVRIMIFIVGTCPECESTRCLSAAGIKSTFSDARLKGKITLPEPIEQRRAATSLIVIAVLKMVPGYPQGQQNKRLTNDSVFGWQAETDRLVNVVCKRVRKSFVILDVENTRRFSSPKGVEDTKCFEKMKEHLMTKRTHV